jgi:Pregnancy-associated plasma protein-A/Secretion system C-terminal sorting domain
VQLQFCLAARTPTGAATNGITRTLTTRTTFNNAAGTLDPDDVKSNATGGKTGWDPQKYLNIWTCRMDDGTLGYAYYPSDIVTTPELDGLVIDYRCIGTTGTAGTGGFTTANLGRTASHEIGHYFNLSHPWGDNDPVAGTCQSDNVADTPACFEPAYGCEVFPFGVGTPCIADGNGQMFMNYMDYSDDNCLYFFTTGQAARMMASLNVERPSLLTSNGCLAPIPVELMSFEGKTVGKTNQLLWVTASERSNAYFEIQRSFDGQFFQNIGQVKGNGTTVEHHDYAFNDGNINGGIAYYRLNQVDFDGKSTLSHIVSLKNGQTNRVRIFPNPVATEGVTVQVEGDGKKEIWLQDVVGRTLFQTVLNDNDLRISTTELARGLYFISVKTASGVWETQKLIVQ